MPDHNFDPDVLEKTEPWDALPTRSVLYNLSPMGLTDHRRESLLSYVVRLARAHCVRPRHLLKEVFAAIDPHVSTLCYNSFYVSYIGTANGLGQYARLFSDLANQLTSRVDLEGLTMLPWVVMIPEKSEGLLSKHPRWCPRCFSEQLDTTGTSYIPLLWTLQLYATCVDHQCPMQDQCPHCGKHQPFIPKFPDLARCDHCGASLENPGEAKESFSGNYIDGRRTLQTENSLAEMIGRHSQVSSLISHADFCTSIRSMISILHGGNRSEFCRAMEWNAWATNGWLDKAQKVSFPKLIEIGLNFEINPIDLCSATISQSQPGRIESLKVSRIGPVTTRAKRPQLEQHHRIAVVQALDRVLADASTPRSLREVGSSWGLKRSAVKYWFPKHCDKICEKRASARRLKATIETAQRVAIVTQTVELLFKEGVYPTKRKVDLQLKKHGLALARPELNRAYISAVKVGAAAARLGSLHSLAKNLVNELALTGIDPTTLAHE